MSSKNIGISADICVKAKCSHYKWIYHEDKYKIFDCDLIDCNNRNGDGCPIPENCKYKNLHILEGHEIDLVYCDGKCSKL